jgi:hypothetical protein
MNQKFFSLKYMLMIYRLDMLWLPVAFWALFLIISWFTRDTRTGFTVCTAYLGAALPLIGGILAAYAVLDDPALELQFATPRPAWTTLVERLGIILVVSAICAISYQGFLDLLRIDLAPLGGYWPRQLAWLAPTLTMIALGSAVSFANRQAMAGSAVIGLIWIFEIILRDWFLQDRWARYVLLIMGSTYPDNPALRGNQVVLISLAGLLLVVAWALLRRQERYI